MTQGWIKFHREWLNDTTITKDAEHLAVWVFLISNASYSKQEARFNGEKIILNEGQLLINHKDIYNALQLEPSKLKRIFKLFKNDLLIDYQTDKHKTLITLTRWSFFQVVNDYQNDYQMTINQLSKQETEKEKEKRSKREKEKEKELYKELKNSRSVCMGDDTHENPSLLTLGKYGNVFADNDWLEDFKSKYWYYDSVIESLSTYKAAKGIVNVDDRPYLELFAKQDKDKYVKESSTFDADDFFEAALKRTYGDLAVDTTRCVREQNKEIPPKSTEVLNNKDSFCNIDAQIPPSTTQELDDKAFLEKAKRDFWADLF